MNEEKREKSETALREETTVQFWKEKRLFEKSVAEPAGAAPKAEYVFYDGPPFATGTPHYGHIVASAIKDVVPRFWTMKGYRVPRKWGWDCHGLPTEVKVEETHKITKNAVPRQQFREMCRTLTLGKCFRYATRHWSARPRAGGAKSSGSFASPS